MSKREASPTSEEEHVEGLDTFWIMLADRKAQYKKTGQRMCDYDEHYNAIREREHLQTHPKLYVDALEAYNEDMLYYENLLKRAKESGGGFITGYPKRPRFKDYWTDSPQ